MAESKPVTTTHVWHGVLDTLEVGLALYDGEGTLVHQNRTFSQLAGAAEEVREIAAGLARDVWQAAHETDTIGSDAVEESISTAEFRSTVGHFRLKGSYVAGQTDSGTTAGMAVVVVRNAIADRVSEAVLREQFGLTQQEARVVGLLTRGRSNKQIARLLDITTHTARHHVESVLKKLVVSKRSEVPARVLGLAEASE